MQGFGRPDRRLLDAAALAEHLVPAGSMFAFLLRTGPRCSPTRITRTCSPGRGVGRPALPTTQMAAVMMLQGPRRSTTASAPRTDLASMPEPTTTLRHDPRHHYARHAALKPPSNHPVRTTTDRTAADPGAAGAAAARQPLGRHPPRLPPAGTALRRNRRLAAPGSRRCLTPSSRGVSRPGTHSQGFRACSEHGEEQDRDRLAYPVVQGDHHERGNRPPRPAIQPGAGSSGSITAHSRVRHVRGVAAHPGAARPGRTAPVGHRGAGPRRALSRRTRYKALKGSWGGRGVDATAATRSPLACRQATRRQGTERSRSVTNRAAVAEQRVLALDRCDQAVSAWLARDTCRAGWLAPESCPGSAC
jgi:hypothetical protein